MVQLTEWTTKLNAAKDQQDKEAAIKEMQKAPIFEFIHNGAYNTPPHTQNLRCVPRGGDNTVEDSDMLQPSADREQQFIEKEASSEPRRFSSFADETEELKWIFYNFFATNKAAGKNNNEFIPKSKYYLKSRNQGNVDFSEDEEPQDGPRLDASDLQRQGQPDVSLNELLLNMTEDQHTKVGTGVSFNATIDSPTDFDGNFLAGSGKAKTRVSSKQFMPFEATQPNYSIQHRDPR